jgi:superfamily I DNA/RNA helicase
MQDETNQNQGLGTRSLFVVGDDAQSIYGFRGSKIEIILNFEDEYPGTREIVLNQNYRSNQQILDLAEDILTHNPNQKKKELFTDSPDATQVQYYMARNERDEAEFIIRKINELYVDLPVITDTTDETDIEIDSDKVRLKSLFTVQKLQGLE